MPTQTPQQLAATIAATGQQPAPAGPGQTAASVITPSTTPAPIAVSTMTQQQTPVAVAPPPVAPVPNVGNITIAPPAAPSPAAGSLSALDQLTAKLSTKATDSQTQINEATIPYQQTLNQLNVQLKQQQAQALQNQETAMKQGDTLGFATREAQSIARTDAIQGMRIAALAEAAQGNLALAEKHATDAVNTQYSQVEADIRTAKQNIYQNYDTFTASEKKRADAALLSLDSQDKFVASAKQDAKDINALAITAASNGADALTLKTIQSAKTPDEALNIMVAKGFAKDPTQVAKDAADLAHTKAETAKLYADANGSTTGIDPTNLIAYAQQYAATGQIPTGLPKGAFGPVAQVAKEMPKPDGTLISNSTGIKPSSLSPTQEDAIIAGRDLIKKLDDLKVDYHNTATGVLAGIKNTILPSEANQRFNDMRKEIIDLLARARTGAVINASEEANYASKLPTNFTKSFFLGKSGDTSIDDLKRSLEGKLQTALSTQGVSIVGYSQIDLGGQKYTVGQTITNGQGQTGRVNADGSVTITQ